MPPDARKNSYYRVFCKDVAGTRAAWQVHALVSPLLDAPSSGDRWPPRQLSARPGTEMSWHPLLSREPCCWSTTGKTGALASMLLAILKQIELNWFNCCSQGIARCFAFAWRLLWALGFGGGMVCSHLTHVQADVWGQLPFCKECSGAKRTWAQQLMQQLGLKWCSGYMKSQAVAARLWREHDCHNCNNVPELIGLTLRFNLSVSLKLRVLLWLSLRILPFLWKIAMGGLRSKQVSWTPPSLVKGRMPSTPTALALLPPGPQWQGRSACSSQLFTREGHCSPRSRGEGVVACQAVSITSGLSLLSFHLYVRAPHGFVLGPLLFSLYFSSGFLICKLQFSQRWWLTDQRCSPKSQSRLAFLMYPSGCLVTTSSPLHPGYAFVLHPISVQHLQATTYPSPSRVTSFLQSSLTHLSSSPDKCSLMGLWGTTTKFPLWIVSGHLFLSVTPPAPSCSSAVPSSDSPTPK